VLPLAEPAGYVRLFVDEGPPMARLLFQIAVQASEPYIRGQLLPAFDLEGDRQEQRPLAEAGETETLIEPLSDREVEVLELVAEGLTNREIARRLFLSPHTVRAHTSNIYSKLNVHNRTEAVARARALGILAADP
jgi:LuxR family maltose regulon positive regulatory protein